MKTALKISALLIALLAVIIGGTFLLLRDAKPANQSIRLSDGTTISFMGTTVGTNHIFGTKLQRIAKRLPRRLEETVLRIAGQQNAPSRIQAAETNLVVWVRQTGTGGGTPGTSRRALLRIPGGRFGGEEGNVHFWLPPGQSNRVHSIQFDSWPRRIDEIECVILEQNSNYKNVPAGSFRFGTPLQNSLPPLTLNPVDHVQYAGDLKVTLLDFATGVGNSTTHRWNAEKKRNEKLYTAASTNEEPRSVIYVKFDSPRGTNETWQMYDADLSDGTGNAVGASSRSGMSDHMVFSPVLWPDEPSWKIRPHIKRTEGFTPEELVTFANVVVPTVNTTNMVNMTNSVNGIEMVFKHLIVRPPLKDQRSWSSRDLSHFRLEHDKLDDTNQIDLVSITVQPMGTNITTTGSSWSNDYHEYNIKSIPTNTTHLDFVFSVQKARFVEFVVDPNWITNDYVIREE